MSGITRGHIYPLGDRPTPTDVEHLKIPLSQHGHVQAVWDGNPPRPPRAGEWYLSGAIITAYRAPNDFTTPYHLARLVLTLPRTGYDIVRS